MRRVTPLRPKRKSKPVELPSREMLCKYLRYEPESGRLYWIRRDHPSHQRLVGVEAFTYVTERGYRRGSFLGRLFMAHRIIWKMVHGTDPQEIDHINGDTGDNRLVNLRTATRQDNVRNACIRKTNRTGVQGVYFRRGYYIASIRRDGKQIELGYFKSLTRAAECRKNAEREAGYHPNHGRAARG